MSGDNSKTEDQKEKEGWLKRFINTRPIFYLPCITKYMSFDRMSKKTLSGEDIKLKCNACNNFDYRENLCRIGYSTATLCKGPHKTKRRKEEIAVAHAREEVELARAREEVELARARNPYIKELYDKLLQHFQYDEEVIIKKLKYIMDWGWGPDIAIQRLAKEEGII